MPDVAATAGAASVLAGAAWATVDPISGLALVASGCNMLGAEAKHRRAMQHETEHVEREQAVQERAKEARALAAKLSGKDWEAQAKREFIDEAVTKQIGHVQALQKELGAVREELLHKETVLAAAQEQVKRSQNDAAAIASQAREKLATATEQVRQKQQWSAELSRRLASSRAELEEQRKQAAVAILHANRQSREASLEAALLRRELASLRWQRRAAAVICVGAAAYGAYRLYQWWHARQSAEQVVGVPISQDNELEVGQLVEEVEQRERSEFERAEEEQRSELFILHGPDRC